MADVIFYEAFEEEAAALRQFLPPEIEGIFTWKTIQESADAAPGAAVISIRTQSIVPVQWASSLSGILSRSTGYDHLLRYRKTVKTDLSMGYLPLYCHRAVAEQAMLTWMTLLRKFPIQLKQLKTFNRDGITGQECAGKILVVVGVGNIGSEIVKIGQGVGMTVLGVDLEHKHAFVRYESIERALPQADIIVCAMNLTAENHGYFSCERLKQAKKGAYFINIARGEMAHSLDLIRLLEESHLAGIGLDVYNREQDLAPLLRRGETSDEAELAAWQRLSDDDRVIMTPHNAFNTRESVERKSVHSIQQLCHFFETGEFLWTVPRE